MKNKWIMLFACISLMAFYSCDDRPPKDVVVEVTTDWQTAPAEPPKETEKTKSDAEIASEIVKETFDFGKVVIKNMKTNDSIRMSNRETMYAYQLGLPIRDKGQLFELYNQLIDKEDVYVLRKSYKDFYLLKYEGKSQRELNDSETVFEKKTGQIASVINIMSLCTKRQKLMVGDKLTQRKDDNEIPCLICDK